MNMRRPSDAMTQETGEPWPRVTRFTALKDGPEYYTVAEVRALLPLSLTTIYDAVRRGMLPARRIGRRILIPKSSLIEMLETDRK